MLSLKTHNILDYVGGALLILAPFLFGFSDVSAARNVMLLTGIILIAYSLLTNYDYSALKVIPLGVHMTLDVLAGVFVMIAPWVFGYRTMLTPGQEYLHYILGVGVFALVGFTREKTESDRISHGIRVGTSTSAAGRV